jgi:hypothetical protein
MSFMVGLVRQGRNRKELKLGQPAEDPRDVGQRDLESGGRSLAGKSARGQLRVALWWILNCKNFYLRFLDSTFPHVQFLRHRYVRDGTVVYKFRNGPQIEVEAGRGDQYVLEEIWMDKAYTSRRGFQVKSTDTIIDIGAHKGFFSLYAGHLAREGRVFSFEPHPGNYSFLQRNLERNNATNIRAFNLAL